MQTRLIAALRARHPKIRSQWEALLRAEPVTTPLAHPDSLVHLIDQTLAEIFALLELSRDLPTDDEAMDRSPLGSLCECGRNPLLSYFAAGEQALLEGLVLAQAASAPLDPVERDRALSVLSDTFHLIARREIGAFCGVCQYRAESALHGETTAVQSLAIHRG